MSTDPVVAWPDAVRAVYVLCHPEKEKARWDRLLPHLLTCGIPAERIRISAPTWGSDLTPQQIFQVYDPFLPRGALPTLTFKSAGLTRAEISLMLNTASALRDAEQRFGADSSGVILTLESDVWLRRDFVPRLRDLLLEAAAGGSSWDYISLGEGTGTRPEGAPASYYAPTRAYPPPHQWVFRCTDSMLFSLNYVKRLNQTIIPFKEIIDWEMNAQLMLHRGKALWADPPLAEQGSWNSRTSCSLY